MLTSEKLTHYQQLREETEKGYLQHAYGDDEAFLAMQLPAELREHLYRSVLVFGPAAEQITQFSEKHKDLELRKDAGSNHIATIAMRNMLGSLGKQTQIEQTCGDRKITIAASIIQWSTSNGHDALEGQLAFLADEPSVFPHDEFMNTYRRLGLYHVYWFLTGQHLFPQELVETCAPQASRVNYILAAAGMPSLKGKLAAANLVVA